MTAIQHRFVVSDALRSEMRGLIDEYDRVEAERAAERLDDDEIIRHSVDLRHARLKENLALPDDRRQALLELSATLISYSPDQIASDQCPSELREAAEQFLWSEADLASALELLAPYSLALPEFAFALPCLVALAASSFERRAEPTLTKESIEAAQ